MIRNEIPYGWSSSAGFAIAFLWRFFLLNLLAVLLLGGLQTVLTPSTGEVTATYILLQVLLTLAAWILAAHWLLQRGYGSKKIVLMEWAHYQSQLDSESGSGGSAT